MNKSYVEGTPLDIFTLSEICCYGYMDDTLNNSMLWYAFMFGLGAFGMKKCKERVLKLRVFRYGLHFST
jgi:hypothetical protein